MSASTTTTKEGAAVPHDPIRNRGTACPRGVQTLEEQAARAYAQREYRHHRGVCLSVRDPDGVEQALVNTGLVRVALASAPAANLPTGDRRTFLRIRSSWIRVWARSSE